MEPESQDERLEVAKTPPQTEGSSLSWVKVVDASVVHHNLVSRHVDMPIVGLTQQVVANRHFAEGSQWMRVDHRA